jgi:predicted RNA-binding protein (virulence factor B family)
MIEIGKYNLLVADKYTDHGLFLHHQDDIENRILLIGTELRLLEKPIEIGEKIMVFVYLDSENRPTATLKNPKVTLHQIAPLKITAKTDKGLFADFGMPKDLFIPFMEVNKPLNESNLALVFMYLDPNTNRLAGTTRLHNVLENSNLNYTVGQEVNIMIWEQTDLGYKVIINEKHIGLVFQNEIFKDIYPGKIMTAYIKRVREDNKIDVTLNKIGIENLQDGSQIILQKLKENGGILNLSDSSPPELIYKMLKMSKKNFKRSAGMLYKQGKIRINTDSIFLSLEE